jgi:hypothetical protein
MIRIIPIVLAIVTMDEIGDIRNITPMRISAIEETAAFLPTALIELLKRLSFILCHTTFHQERLGVLKLSGRLKPAAQDRQDIVLPAAYKSAGLSH